MLIALLIMPLLYSENAFTSLINYSIGQFKTKSFVPPKKSIMNIQVNSDNNITGTEGLSNFITSIIAETLKRFDEQITRIEVHLNDENSHKSGNKDKRCMLEARLEGLQPIAVTAHGDTIQEALKEALSKLKSSLDTSLGRLQNH
jgi:ribosome-associated translation inhibitor RaiA